MPSISLRKQPGMYLTHSGLVVVHDLPLPSSNLFKRYRHTPLSSFRPDNIYLYEGSFTFMNFWGNRSNLQITNEYSTVPLKYADIYFNKFDKSNTPLVCVLKFHNKKDGKTVQDRIYLHSRDVYLVNQSSYTNITTLSPFDASDEKELLDLLLKETNTLLKTIIYDVDKKNTQTHPISYGPDEITLSAKQGVNYDSFNMFSKYIHKPKNRRPPKSFVLYNNNAPMVDNNTFLSNIQQEPHDSITVYFSNELDTPLVIESIKNGKRSHFQRINSDGTKWISNDIENYTEQKLVSYLGTVYRFVKGKKEEEQQRREREIKTREKQGRDQLGERGPREQGTQRTDDLGPQTTQTRHEIQERTISTREEVQADDHVTYSPKPKPTLTCNISVLIDKQEPYEKSEVVEKTCKPEPSIKSDTQILDVQPTKISVIPFDQKDIIGKNTGYKYFIHFLNPDLTKLNGKGKTQDILIDLSIYISNIDISIFDRNRRITKLNYNRDVSENSLYVYFYEHNTNTNKTDTVPLMIHYNGDFYGPSERDNYFSGWNWIDGINGISDESGIKDKLDSINKELNRIELTNKGGDKCSYGLPKFFKPEIQKFDTDRVKVTIQSKNNYTRVIHRTINSFTIGDIYYGSKDITANGGIQINGGGTITIGTSKHTSFINGTNKPNTVVAYYHKDDRGYKLPQLIVLMTTNQAIMAGQSQKPISAKPSTNYGYYVLATGDNGGSYKYEWRTPDEDTGKTLVLDPETEFTLLNAVVILVDKQDQYQERDISSAVQRSKITSPGNTKDVNRLKEKMINAREETGASASSYGDPAKCVSNYGYKLYSHDITTLVTWTLTNGKPESIPLIGGLRFLVPSSENATGYQEINLYKDEGAKEPVDRLYHIRTKNSIYIFFYGSDPRPLLLCYNGLGYKPRKQRDPIPEVQVIMEYTQWTRVNKITECTCMGDVLTDNDKNILDTLLEVVLFLNPVQINPMQIPDGACRTITANPPKPPFPTSTEYNLHKFTENKTVKMKITRTNISCYEQYKYEPNGTGGVTNGNGFRLGNILHTKTNRGGSHSYLKYTDLSHTYKYHPLIGVSVFYYDKDSQYSDPLLIELEFKQNGAHDISKEYYNLKTLVDKNGAGMKWKLDPDAQTQIGVSSEHNQKLVSYLDKIRYNFKNVLQVCIAHKQANPYNAKLLDRNSDNPVKSQEEIKVTVSEETNCGSLNSTGFRCFKHAISSLNSNELHKIGALLFFIPDKDSAGLVKLNLYDTQSTGLVPIQPLYYNCGMGDICVFFYGSGSGGDASTNNGDPRPLLLCYNNKAYKAWTMETYDKHMWLKSTEIRECVCKTVGYELLKALVKVCNFLNPVYINRTVRGVYRIHRFNGQHIEIQLQETKAQSSFCYNKYVHSPKPGFRLGRIEIESSKQCIYEWTAVGGSDKCITSVLDDPLDKYTPASEVVVYYYQGDKMYKNPLLVVLCKKGEVGVRSTTSTCQCKPYYELQRSAGTSTTNKKVYKKVDNTIELDSRKGKQLEKTLDRILYYISKSILIDLSFRKTTKPEIIQIHKNHCTTPFEGKYEARVYDNIENKSQSGKTDKTIDVNVCGPIKIINDKKDKTGYQCYCHKLTTVKDVNQIGGLKLFLWDNRDSDDDNKSECKVTGHTTQNNHLTKRPCCEITLWESCNVSKPQPAEITPIAYTTCKGDLYVYFYGSDPRPLLLCYNGEAYVPNDLHIYITVLR